MKGIILAGGNGSRLYPLTIATNKHLLPVYDKPMIYYPLSTLMLAGIRKILIVSSPEYLETYKKLLGYGERFGLQLSYIIQCSPNGVGQAFLLGEEFVCNDSCALILGDSFFFGSGFKTILEDASRRLQSGVATIFTNYVSDPERYGIIEFDRKGQAISIEEKPKYPKSNQCVTGLYFYDNRVFGYAKDALKRVSGELEITAINRYYLDSNSLKIQPLGTGFAWFDLGTIESLVEATIFVKTIATHQGYKISVPEEIAFYNGWIDVETLNKAVKQYGSSAYGMHLKQVAEGEKSIPQRNYGRED